MSDISTLVNTYGNLPLISFIANEIDKYLKERCDTHLVEYTTSFHRHEIPALDLNTYMQRIMNVGKVPFEGFVVALILLLRVLANENFVLAYNNIHTLVLACVVVGQKKNFKKQHSCARYARAGFEYPERLREAEQELSIILHGNVVVSTKDIQKCVTLLSECLEAQL